MAVAELKRNLPDPVRRIDLHDLVMNVVDNVAAEISEQPLSIANLDGTNIQDLWEKHNTAAAPLMHLLITGVWHDPEGVHDRLWLDVLQRLVDAGTKPIGSCTGGWMMRAFTLHCWPTPQWALRRSVVAANR